MGGPVIGSRLPRGGEYPSMIPLKYGTFFRVELGDVTLVLPRWEAVHAAGGGQRGAELRDDYYGGGSPPVEGY